MATTPTDGGGAKPTSYDIARSLIRKLGGNPNNTALVRAVAIWMRFETGSTITGNNPWNIRGRGPCGGHYFGKNGPFKTYCSLDQGLTDTARLLSISSYGYPKIKAAVVAGDPRGFLVAVYTSKWCHSATQTFCYNNGRSLLNALAGSLSYNWTPSYRNGTPGAIPTGGGSGTTVGTGAVSMQTVNLREWVQGVLGPDATADHVITAQDVDKLFIDVKARFDAIGDFPGKQQALAGVSTGLSTMIGKKVSDLSGTISLPALPAGGSDPLDAIAGALGGVGDVLAFLLDAENWFYMGMLAAGVVISAWSFRNLFGAEIGQRRPATIVTEAVTEAKGAGKTLTKTRSKTA